ncbi:putative encoded peptide [Helianthus annuus]|nr:putative encoded peptide [Helianthus annuus]KAJ0454601.1 putative encoded peptide [Helianthus annuus]KAJ0830401.1 putative encoded peptide [Helianthus annuus]KAJ0843780.1 putative encoded peptide [Helianthus annuus]
MARWNRKSLCCIFIMLLTIELLQANEARKIGENFRCTANYQEKAMEDHGSTNPSQAPPPYGVDAFRPTTPGHSPGVGHSVQN